MALTLCRRWLKFNYICASQMLLTLQNKDTQILQQNEILLGGQTINLRARQLLYALAACMDKDNPNAEIKIEAVDFLNFVNQGSSEKWSDIYALTNSIFEHLNDNPILLKKPRKKDFVKVNWLSELGVVNGNLTARFTSSFAEYLVYKQGLPYTKILWDLRPYKSSYTARIMDLFQRYHTENRGEDEFSFTYDYEELRLFFGVHDKYSRSSDFKKRVLETTREELEENDFLPYWFTYSEIRKGKKLQSLKFVVNIRPKILLELIPSSALWTKNKNQLDIFDVGRDVNLSKAKKELFQKLLKTGLKKDYAGKVLSTLSDSQSIGYYDLVVYGVNRNLALTIVKKHCSFGELMGNEGKYIRHTLLIIEKARLERIEEAKTNKSKKRITPDGKRGGLPKKVFEERQHFASFMEILSQSKHKRTPDKPSSGMDSIGDILSRTSIQ